MNVAAQTKKHPNPVVELESDGIKTPEIWNCFQNGAKAIHLKRDPRIKVLWDQLVTKQIESARGPFWNNGLQSFARNHGKGQQNVGDMWRFVPGSIGHIARKMIVYPELGSSRFHTIPKHFWHEDEKDTYSQELLELIWEFATEVFESSMPADFSPPPHAVAVEFLKYPNSMSDLERTFDLLDDRGWGWTNVGTKIDMFREMAAGPFNKKWIRDLYGLGSLVPGISHLLNKINNAFIQNSQERLPEGLRALGEPHIDGIRALTMLMSDRDVISTDIFDDYQWHEMQMDTESLFIFPGGFLSKELGLEPTLHRYSIKTHNNQTTTSKMNLTLLFGIVDLESFMPLSKFFI